MPRLERFLLLTLVLSASAFAQANVADEPASSFGSIEDPRWRESQSAELIAPLQAQAVHYREAGQDVLAARTIERILEIVRVNYGLHSLEQVPLLRQSIEIAQARGDHAAAWQAERELLSLLQRHPEDLSTVPILHQIADARMSMLQRYSGGELPPEIVLGCFYRRANISVTGCSSGSKGAAIRHVLQEASQLYEDAIAVLLRNELYSSDEIKELELKVIRANYFYGAELYPPSRYERGKERLRMLADYGSKSSDVLSEVDALVQIGDWELMYSNNSQALRTYRQAYEKLAGDEIAAESVDQLFAPDIPVVLPAFLPNPLVSEETPQSAGFIDVAFEITRFGRSRQIEVLDTSTNARKEDTDWLTGFIAHSRFRPRTKDGNFRQALPVVLRYHLAR